MPGVGLLLLRATVGIAFLSCGMLHLVAWQEAKGLTLIVATLASMCGLLLLVGLFNSLVCTLGALISLGTALALIHVPTLSNSSGKVLAGFTALIAIALLCLGPGAYSLDARRHGRREIVIPVRPRPSNGKSL